MLGKLSKIFVFIFLFLGVISAQAKGSVLKVTRMADSNILKFNVVLENDTERDSKFYIDFREISVFGCGKDSKIAVIEIPKSIEWQSSDSYGVVPKKGWALRDYKASLINGNSDCYFTIPIRFVADKSSGNHADGFAQDSQSGTLYLNSKDGSEISILNAPDIKNIFKVNMYMEESSVSARKNLSRVIIFNDYNIDSEILLEKSFISCRDKGNNSIRYSLKNAINDGSYLIKSRQWGAFTIGIPDDSDIHECEADIWLSQAASMPSSSEVHIRAEAGASGKYVVFKKM